MPSSESDSEWYLASYAGVEALPEVARFEQISGCREGGATRRDIGETLDKLGNTEPPGARLSRRSPVTGPRARRLQSSVQQSRGASLTGTSAGSCSPTSP